MSDKDTPGMGDGEEKTQRLQEFYELMGLGRNAIEDPERCSTEFLDRFDKAEHRIRVLVSKQIPVADIREDNHNLRISGIRKVVAAAEDHRNDGLAGIAADLLRKAQNVGCQVPHELVDRVAAANRLACTH